MRKEFRKDKASRLINPGNLILVTCSYKDKDNITTCAWHSPSSHKPASLLVCLAKEHLSCELIRKSEEFIINVPDFSLKDPVIFCGTHSGRSCDKFKEAKLTKEKANVLLKTPKVKECIGSIECSLVDTKEMGDHFVFFGQPLYADAKEDYFDFDNFVWNNRAELIFHLGGKFFMKQGSIE